MSKIDGIQELCVGPRVLELRVLKGRSNTAFSFEAMALCAKLNIDLLSIQGHGIFVYLDNYFWW
jgi:hypothetical protein